MSVWNDGDRNDIIREYRRQEYLDREAEKECCGNCRYHVKEEGNGDYICDNEDSIYCMDYTSYTDGCTEYERR